jgi:hypothetical protein
MDRQTDRQIDNETNRKAKQAGYTRKASITFGRMPTQAFKAASKLPNEGISMFSKAGTLNASLNCGKYSSKSNA